MPTLRLYACSIGSQKIGTCLRSLIKGPRTQCQLSIIPSRSVFSPATIQGCFAYASKVEAKNLQPFTTYYYQFNVCGSAKRSPLGRTKTSPTPDDGTSEIGLAVYSCSNYRKLALFKDCDMPRR